MITTSPPHVNKTIQNQLIWIITASTVIRLVLASVLELGNDEVYYWTYGQFPDLSHFDHPLMVGLVISLSTLNDFLSNDFFMRFGPIVFSAANTWLLFSLVKEMANERAGLFAALLFNSSVYFSLISGFAIIPDAPLILFWLMGLRVLLDILPVNEIGQREQAGMILFGVCAGFAILSKYHGVFIWVGAFSYVLLYNRKWLANYSFYTAIIVSMLMSSPILIWNIQNDFITVTFHGERVAPSFGLRPDYFLRELGGQLLYQNPLNAFVFIPVVIALFKRRPFMDSKLLKILLLNGLPLWLLFTGFSLFRSTLPHWTGPSFISLIIIAAIYWSDRVKTESKGVPFRIIFPVYFLAGMVALAVYLINYSPFHFGKTDDGQLGDGDFTQDMYGWDAIGESFSVISKREEEKGVMPKNADLISFRWFPGSHLDYYVARPSGRRVFLIGELNDIHKYAWINEDRGGLVKGKDYYYIAPGNYYRDPQETFGSYFERIEPMDTVRIKRGGEVMRYAFFYRMKNYKGNFTSPLQVHVVSE